MNTHVESDGAAGPGFSAASIIRVTVRIKQRHFVAHLESNSDLNAIQYRWAVEWVLESGQDRILGVGNGAQLFRRWGRKRGPVPG